MGGVAHAVGGAIDHATSAVTSVVDKVPVVGPVASGGIKTVVGAATLNPSMAAQGFEDSKNAATGDVNGVTGSPQTTAAIENVAGAAIGVPDAGGLLALGNPTTAPGGVSGRPVLVPVPTGINSAIVPPAPNNNTVLYIAGGAAAIGAVALLTIKRRG